VSEERQRHGLSFLEYIGAAPKWSLERKPFEEQRQVRDVSDAVIRRPRLDDPETSRDPLADQPNRAKRAFATPASP
jgi:hypothetical protein